jgi:hypothetical protein
MAERGMGVSCGGVCRIGECLGHCNACAPSPTRKTPDISQLILATGAVNLGHPAISLE